MSSLLNFFQICSTSQKRSIILRKTTAARWHIHQQAYRINNRGLRTDPCDPPPLWIDSIVHCWLLLAPQVHPKQRWLHSTEVLHFSSSSSRDPDSRSVWQHEGIVNKKSHYLALQKHLSSFREGGNFEIDWYFEQLFGTPPLNIHTTLPRLRQSGNLQYSKQQF